VENRVEATPFPAIVKVRVNGGSLSIPMKSDERLTYRACHLCEALCGIEIRSRGAEILGVRGHAADTFSRGHICP
jgi:anaerobic selenocysteine-containing dehydrogenase